MTPDRDRTGRARFLPDLGRRAVLERYHEGLGSMLLHPAWAGVSDPIRRVFALLGRYRSSSVETDSRTENLGGVGRGFVESDNGAFLFPPTQYAADGQAMSYRVRWTPVGSDSYEAWSEARSGDGWSTMFRLTLKRAP